MSSATPSRPARALAIFAAAFLGATAMMLMLNPAPAEAAKPCWERVIDDWLDNSRIDGVYSARCLEEARKNLPEDVRAYSDIEEKIDSALQGAGRSPQAGPGGSDGSSGDGSGGSGGDTPPVVGEPEPDTGPQHDEGPIEQALGKTQTDATSIPLPLIILAALALLLMAAGAAGVAARKLQARRARTGAGG
jgi:hypothetical protein